MTKRITNPYSKVRRGRRADIGNMYFRSMMEANFARYLNLLQANGDIHHWEYESETFWFEAIKRGVRSYKPDFKVWDTESAEPYFYEVKGWMDAKSKTKLTRMAKYYPAVKIIVIGKKEYNDIRKSLSSIIPNWEGK